MRYFYYNPIKPLLIILFASLAFIILQPILVAYADDATSKPLKEVPLSVTSKTVITRKPPKVKKVKTMDGGGVIVAKVTIE